MKLSTLDALVWVLIYGGMLGIALGLAVRRSIDTLGWGLVAVGGVMTAVGAALVVVRSRRRDEA
jgi:F0F1-type ATP synthase assembly protein I